MPSRPRPAGWPRVLAQPRVAPALRAMHADPARTCKLARVCAMSRTTFVRRFRAAAGVAPLTYLANWRMRLAELELQEEG